ncbi:MAG: AraC family transcriptional regulator [Caulobacteraceae bacterium]|nr:AraC family transcriptional regulator [Caulobacteraceae bacterium]
MGFEDLFLGWRTAALGLLILEIVVLAGMIMVADPDRAPPRLLAGALLVISGLLTPYAIGFAGAYDVWRGLTFAPFAIPLALGPLLYAYASALETGRAPRHIAWHATPAGVQLAYLIVCFLLPTSFKWAWYTGGHNAFVAPVFSSLTLVSLGGYAWAIGRVLARYRARLADNRSDDDRFSARWLSRVRFTILITLVIEVGFWLWAFLTGGIDYFQETGLYLVLGAIGLYLGVAGWRQTGLPALAEDTAHFPIRPPTLDPTDGGQGGPDWATIAADFAARTRAEAWWREPGLTLPGLARRLATNTGKLSRAINLGLGMNFSTFINSLRAEGVAEALAAHSETDLLDLAFEMGFASKASFNRAFHARYGTTPSKYRRDVSDRDSLAAATDLRRAGT